MVDVLHINDNNLVIESADNVSNSRGYAWLKGKDVIFDIEGTVSPENHCRLAPQEINNRYWQQCEQSAIPSNGAGMRHAADLIWQHLGQLKRHRQLSELVLIVPSHYRESNLQLLLGISKACHLEVKGLVNKAIVALQNQVRNDGEYCHFDVQLHQTVCSRILLSDGLLKLGDVEILSDVGIHLMQEALLKGLQNNFIQNDRFDPLHDAATEQQLFDQLASIAMQLTDSGKASVALQHQGRLHNTTLDNKEWHALLKPFSDRLLAISRTADGSYIDLNTAFDKAGLDLLSDEGFVHLTSTPKSSIKQLVQEPDSSSIIYKTDLPIKSSVNQANTEVDGGQSGTYGVASKPSANTLAVASVSVADTESSLAPLNATHLLLAGKALSIGEAQFTMENGVLGLAESATGNAHELLASNKLFILNDEGRTELRVNDRIASHIADGVVTVIQVL